MQQRVTWKNGKGVEVLPPKTNPMPPSVLERIVPICASAYVFNGRSVELDLALLGGETTEKGDDEPKTCLRLGIYDDRS